MCKDCGCLTANHPVFEKAQAVNPHSHEESHAHAHADTQTHTHTHNLGDTGKTRQLRIEETLFKQNQEFAAQNRIFFKKHNLKVFNFMSSPGSGKTTLLCKILPNLAKKNPLAVVVGDQETDIDASRLRSAGINSFQINTHSACHLDAHRVGHAVEHLPLQELSWIVIENVGNLVCPAVFDLGETFKVAILSTAEGEEKPLKYPVLFHDADLIVITKSDLIPYLDYNVEALTRNIRSLNKTAPLIFCSGKTGDGTSDLMTALENLTEEKGVTHVSGFTGSNTQP